jgi:membrane-bound acyltransferase YfiQ involved in biofilm formation
MSRSQYITRYRPEYPVIAYANESLEEDSRILALYIGSRIYYSDRRMDSNNSIFFKFLESASSGQALAQILFKDGFTHILIRFDLLQHRIDTIMKSSEKDILKDFFQKYLREIYVANGIGLFALIPN